MLFGHSLESRLLLACARTVAEPKEIQELVRFDLDWREILERAVQYEVAPLIYSNLKKAADSNQVPTKTLEQFKGLYYRQAIQNMNLYHKLKEVLVAFSEEGIPVIVLKGAALAELVYQNIALRPMRDLDLLVRKEDLNAADHLLQKLGYFSNALYQTKEWYRDNHHHLAPYIARDRTLVLELHHHILWPTAPVSIPIQDLWQRARPATIASTTTLVFAPEDLLLHVCLHLSCTGEFLGKLRILCDIAETIGRYREEIVWAQLVREAQAYQVGKFLYYPLWLAQGMVKAEIPTGVMKHLKSSFHARTFDDRSLKFITRRAVLMYDQEASPIPSWVIYDTCLELLSAKRVSDKIRTVFKRIYQGFVYSAQQVCPQPRFLAALYTIFIHPFYLMARAVFRKSPQSIVVRHK